MDYMGFNKVTHPDKFIQKIYCLLLKMQITGKVRKVTTLAPQSPVYHLRDTTTYLGLIKYFVSTAYGAKLLVSSYPLFSTAF